MKVAFIGKMHSGKTEALQHFVSLSESCHIVKFADPLYKTQNLFLKEETKNRLFLQDLSDLAKKHFGQDILNKMFKHRIEYFEKCSAINRSNIFCDDVRLYSEFQTVKECGFITIGIEASDAIRQARNPSLYVGTQHRTELEIDLILANCDYLLSNDSSLELFRALLTVAFQENKENY